MLDYDKGWSQQWLDCEIYGPTLRHQRKNIQRLLSGLEYSSILDIGAGSGDNLSQFLKGKKIGKVSLLDISKEALNRAKRVLPQADFIQLDIEKNFTDNKYELIICCDVLEHLYDDLSALKNIRRMASKYLLISTLAGKMRESEKYVGHVRNYTLEGLLDKLSTCGFKPLKIVKWGFPFYSPIYRKIWDRLPQEINYGRFGLFRKLCANFLYLVFMFNSKSRGDYLFVLCEAV